MQTISLQATARSSDVSARELRSKNIVPCILYGNEVKNQPLECGSAVLHKAYAQAGASTLVELDLAGAKVPVLFHEVAFDPVSGRIIHADFYAVNMKKEIEAEIPLEFVGEAPAVKEQNAVLVYVHDHVLVKCLPGKLPHSISVDISKLAAFHDVVTAADLTLPEGVKLIEELETVLVVAQESRKEEVEEPVVAAAVEGAPAEGDAAAAADKKEA